MRIQVAFQNRKEDPDLKKKAVKFSGNPAVLYSGYGGLPSHPNHSDSGVSGFVPRRQKCCPFVLAIHQLLDEQQAGLAKMAPVMVTRFALTVP
mmetsp:Transcript_5749/g.11212  ORF Transcript_5749/g.11212 Transcript_5749/m.11212 type:complete len:93 (+) Transcript_5749:71-349(+)